MSVTAKRISDNIENTKNTCQTQAIAKDHLEAIKSGKSKAQEVN